MRINSNARSTLFRNNENGEYFNISNLMNYGIK